MSVGPFSSKIPKKAERKDAIQPVSLVMKKRELDSQGQYQHAAAWMKVLPVVSAYVRSVLRNYHDSEDVIQNIAVVFAAKFDSLDADRDITPWVLRIARYEVVNYYRSRGREKQFLDDETLQVIERTYHSLENEAEDVKAALRDCIRQLNERPRRVLELRYFREMGIGDISRHLGISNNAIYIMLCRVREALARCVQRKSKLGWELT